MKSLFFNDIYRCSSEEVFDLMYDDVDMEFYL